MFLLSFNQNSLRCNQVLTRVHCVATRAHCAPWRNLVLLRSEDTKQFLKAHSTLILVLFKLQERLLKKTFSSQQINFDITFAIKPIPHTLSMCLTDNASFYDLLMFRYFRTIL